MRRSRLNACISAAALAVIPAATWPLEQTNRSMDEDVVTVLATVRDRSDRIVSNLARDDFVLEEDGKPQEILYFSRQTDLPLIVGVLVDTSKSQSRLLDTERYASYKFLEQVLRPGQDLAFVMRFDTEVVLLQDLTDSLESLEAALKRLETVSPKARWGDAPAPWPEPPRRLPPLPPRPWPPLPPQPQPPFPPRPGIGAHLYDALSFAARRVLLEQTGRKTVIVISDGIGIRSQRSRESAIEEALRADTLVYCIRFYDSDAYSATEKRQLGRGASSRASRELTAISAETGGLMFETSTRLPLPRIFLQIEEELRNQYSIGYVPPKGSPDAYRRIKLTTKDGKLTVHARQGYYPKVR